MVVRLAFLGLLIAAPAIAGDQVATSNAKMVAIFKADQADRSVHPVTGKSQDLLTPDDVPEQINYLLPARCTPLTTSMMLRSFFSMAIRRTTL